MEPPSDYLYGNFCFTEVLFTAPMGMINILNYSNCKNDEKKDTIVFFFYLPVNHGELIFFATGWNLNSIASLCIICYFPQRIFGVFFVQKLEF